MSTSRIKTLRTLVVGSEWNLDSPGGLNRYVEDLTPALSPLVDQTVLVLARTEVVHPFRRVGSPDQSIGRRLYAYSREVVAAVKQVDLVVAHFALYALAAIPFMGRKPLVVHFHGPWFREARVSGENRLSVGLKYMIETLVYRRADSIIVLSQAFRNELVDSFHVAPAKISVIPPGVDTGRFTHSQERTHREPTFICVRRLVPRMGVEVLLRAWASSSLRGFRLQVVGDGPDRSRLEAIADDLGIAENVDFVGRIGDDDLAGRYSAARASIIPSISLEGFGLVALESWASGTPVIGTAVGGLGEVLTELCPKWVIEPDSVASLQDALERASVDGSLPSGDECTKWANLYSWTNAASSIYAVYDRAAKQL